MNDGAYPADNVYALAVHYPRLDCFESETVSASVISPVFCWGSQKLFEVNFQ
jgi:hypothetical protein